MAEGAETSTLPDRQAGENRKDAVFPKANTLDMKGWQNFIESDVDGFDGDIESASRLMSSYQKGRDYIYDRFSPKFGDFIKPDIMVVLDEEKVQGSPFGSINQADKIFVTKSFLEQFSSYKKDSTCKVVRQDGSIAIDATPDQIFELHGIEETHHSLFDAIKKSTNQSVGPNITDLASYDAQEHEYRALRWQIQYAVENNFSEKTLGILKDRLDKAQNVRLQKKV